MLTILFRSFWFLRSCAASCIWNQNSWHREIFPLFITGAWLANGHVRRWFSGSGQPLMCISAVSHMSDWTLVISISTITTDDSHLAILPLMVGRPWQPAPASRLRSVGAARRTVCTSGRSADCQTPHGSRAAAASQWSSVERGGDARVTCDSCSDGGVPSAVSDCLPPSPVNGSGVSSEPGRPRLGETARDGSVVPPKTLCRGTAPIGRLAAVESAPQELKR